MKRNILTENMLRFGTKNLSETNLQDLENKLGFNSGANRDPRTGNLKTSDSDQNNDGYPDATSGNNDSEFAKLVTAIESALDALSDPNYPNYDPGEDIFLTTDEANEVISCELLSGPWKAKAVSAIKSVLKQFRNFIIDPNSLYKDSESINFDIVRK